jgi:hypothetical protein
MRKSEGVIVQRYHGIKLTIDKVADIRYVTFHPNDFVDCMEREFYSEHGCECMGYPPVALSSIHPSTDQGI